MTNEKPRPDPKAPDPTKAPTHDGAGNPIIYDNDPVTVWPPTDAERDATKHIRDLIKDQK